MQATGDDDTARHIRLASGASGIRASRRRKEHDVRCGTYRSAKVGPRQGKRDMVNRRATAGKTRPMKFGFYSQLMDPNLTRVYSDQLDELREQVVFCEQAGFDIAWVDEHHFNVAFADSPNPIVPGSMLAAHTSRIRIGMLVISALWHPLRLAEDVALLDHLSKGRVEVAMGRGSNPSDVANLNPLLTGVWPDLNARFEQSVQTASREVYAEVVEILKKAWIERFFFHKGRYSEFPQPGFPGGAPAVPQDPTAVRDGEIVKICLNPKPYQKPHPPL